MAKKVMSTPEGDFVEGSPEYNARVKADAEYRIDFYASQVAANPSFWPHTKDLAKAYEDAAKSGVFSASQTKLFKDRAKEYADQVPELKQSYNSARDLESSADTIRRTIYDQAVANRDSLFNDAVERRDTLRNAADSFLNTSLEQISKDVADGKLNVNQANALRNQAREQHTNARSVAESNFNVERAAATEAFDQGKTYSTEIQQGIMSGQVDPSGQFKAPTPQVGGLAAIPTFQNLNYEAVRDIAAPVVEPRTGPIQRVEPEKIVAQKPEIGDIVGDMMREMEAQEAEIAQPIAPQTIPFVAAGKFGLTDEQARGIAEQLVISGYFNVDNVDDLVNFIKTQGPEAAIERIESTPGASLTNPVGFVPYDLAKEAVEFMYSQYGIEQDPQKNAGGMQYKPNWIRLAQNQGIEETAKRFAERQPVQPGSPADPGPSFKFFNDDADVSSPSYSLVDAVNAKFTPEYVETAYKTYTDAQRASLDDAINRILEGEDLTPNLNYTGSSEDLVRMLATQAGGTFNPDDPYSQYLIDFADRFGPEAAVAEFNARSRAPLNLAPVAPVAGSDFDARDIYDEQPIAPGQSASIYEKSAGTGAGASIYGDQPQQATSTFPGQPPVTYTPAPIQAQVGLPAALPGPRSFVTETERPMLAPQTQYIGAPSVDRGVREPMQPFVPSQFGLNTLTPLQYLEAARAAGLPVSANAPVEPFATPVGSDVPVEGLKEGGLASVAKTLESKGRKGDSMLVHMSPDEVAGLQQLAMKMGTSLTVNPQTGLPEAIKLRKLLPVIAAAFGAPYLSAGLGISATAGAALAGGLAGIGTMLGGGSLKEGLTMGLTAFGAAGLSSGAMGSNPLGVGGESTFNLANTFGPASTGTLGAEAGGVEGLNPLATGEISRVSPSIEQLSQVPATVAPPSASSGTILGMKPSTALVGGMMASSLYAGEQERDMYQKQYDDFLREQEDRKRRGMESFNRSSMPTRMAAKGGLMALAGGGITYAEGGGTTGPTNEPRMVQGTGDGMSDSVPATIEGVQEARLANDEFVIPADVVADLGNGSSNAGAKQLYAMMDRIRKARHGTTEQPPEINAMKLMPA